MNMTDAFQGAPAFASKPNFYQADPSYRSYVDGLDEASSADETVLKVEPTTGATFSGSQQLMISVLVSSAHLVYATQRAHSLWRVPGSPPRPLACWHFAG